MKGFFTPLQPFFVHAQRCTGSGGTTPKNAETANVWFGDDKSLPRADKYVSGESLLYPVALGEAAAKTGVIFESNIDVIKVTIKNNRGNTKETNEGDDKRR
jgi:hypothetical protein